VPFDVCSASSLLSTNVTSAVYAGLISVNAAGCFTRLPSPITADRYHYSGRIGIGRDMQTDIMYSRILLCHESISHIGLTLVTRLSLSTLDRQGTVCRRPSKLHRQSVSQCFPIRA